MKKVGYYKFFIICIKLSEATYYQKNREITLNRAKEYYKNNKGRLKEQARNKYRELSEKEKDVKKEYGRNRYKNMSEENKFFLNTKKIIVKLKNKD